jgi:hypothetical protein
MHLKLLPLKMVPFSLPLKMVNNIISTLFVMLVRRTSTLTLPFNLFPDVFVVISTIIKLVLLLNLVNLVIILLLLKLVSLDNPFINLVNQDMSKAKLPLLLDVEAFIVIMLSLSAVVE